VKYKDLVNFDPVESIIKLTDANKKQDAERFVRTYVMSDSMADALISIVLPQLQFENTVDNKGIFIVGNYGTGKSHLMSVISAIAENKDMLDLMKNERFKREAECIAGKFEVLRFEIGASKMDLRDIVTREIEKDLYKRGIEYKFPSMEEVSNTTDSLVEMMNLFQEKYPDKGYLIVVDELLDYLRHLTEQKMVLALTFLREMGEVSKVTRIRFMAGLQESLFESGQFSFVADSLNRVKARFEQIMIKKQDISYVVSERILKKNERQKAWIREHLAKFGPLYKNLADRLEEYVNLFPIHPSYIETFEKVYIAEKREVLKTISITIKNLLEKEVPEDDTGIISYDSYWDFIKDNPGMRSDADIREVIEKSGVLESLIEHSYTRPQYKPMAKRIIYALSVKRLTTGDIHAPLGLTVDNMKDDLFLYTQMPEMEESFLKTTIETVMKEILKTVSGQFITYNRDNEQYYLDLKKDIDYDAKIQARADFIEDEDINKYYYSIILKAMEWERPEYVGGRRIYQYELTWEERNVERRGYLFMGLPNERTTAQPPRDFYIYFLPPYGNNKHDGVTRPDEVYFEFANRDEKVDEYIRMYAAAMSMYDISSGSSKSVYYDKAGAYQKKAVEWIREHIKECFEVRYDGECRTILYWLKSRAAVEITIKDYIDMTASTCLSPYFAGKYPDYPRFSVLVTQKNTRELFKSAINYIAGKKTDVGAKVLDSLGLLDEEKNISPEHSIYAKHFINLVNKLPEQQVLNREEIFDRINADEELDKKFKLEPWWVLVIMASLIYSGDITLTTSAKKYDATMLEEMAADNTADLLQFKHCQRPMDIPIEALKCLFKYLDIPPGQITNPNTRAAAVEMMLKRINDMLGKIIDAQKFMYGEINIWGKPVINESKKQNYKEALLRFREFLDTLKKYNTPAKLKNFKPISREIEDYFKALEIIKELNVLKSFKQEIDPYASYLASAELVLKDEAWGKKVTDIKHEIENIIKEPAGIDDDISRRLTSRLRQIKDEYIQKYMDLHKKYRLDLSGDERRKKILNGNLKQNLEKLTGIKDIIPQGKLKEQIDRLSSLKVCFALIEDNMKNTAVCPHCNFNPADGERSVFGELDSIEDALDKLYEEWKNILVNFIDDPRVSENIGFLREEQQRALKPLIEGRALPEKVDAVFVSAINDLSRGLEKIEVSAKDIESKVFGSGPSTLEDLKKRFMDFLDEISRGRDAGKIRIILK
jgi:hypothetical protein